MTCIIGYKQDDKVWVGADSCASTDNYRFSARTKKLIRKDNMLIGSAGSYRQINLIKHELVIPPHPKNMSTDRYINILLVNALRSCFAKAGFSKIESNQEEFDGSLLVGYRGRLFELCTDFQILENYKPYAAVGSATELSLGALHVLNTTKDLTPRQKLYRVFRAASTHDNRVKPPFHIRSI